MGIKELIGKEIVLFDGAIGTMLQNKGLKLGENPERLNFTNENIVLDIHKEYVNAGARVITTNTFGANRLKVGHLGYSVEEIISKAVKLAKSAINDNDSYVALDIGPIGELLEPMGTLKFDEAYELFKEQIVAGVNAGVDLILIETMTDLYEAKAAILAAKENSNLPILCTMSFESDNRTFTGCTPASMAITLEGLGVDALGVNCSLGPDEILTIIKEIKQYTNIPLMVQPNAGLPSLDCGEVVFNFSSEEFVKGINNLLLEGVSIIGGCCGTTPRYIKELKELICNKDIVNKEYVSIAAVCSQSKLVNINSVKVIGERINPTGKKLFKEALKNSDIDYILRQGIIQVDAGADILDVNVGLPEIDEASWMRKAICSLQGILDTPLQIDSTSPEVIEIGLRYYNGKPIVNSVNGEDEVLDTVLPLVKKYGAAVVGLTLDKNGIPKTAKERYNIAEKILNKALSYGIKKEDVYIDTLTLPISSDQESAKITLNALKLVKGRLGLKTLLGVSNVSFGLPCRDVINKNFLCLAFGAGLDLPIINPNIDGMMETVNSFNLLYNYDPSGSKFISIYGNRPKEVVNGNNSENDDLKQIVIRGLKDEGKRLAEELIKTKKPLEVVNEYIVPALNIVGTKFEKGEIFLPQLISSAETVQRAFDVIKSAIVLQGEEKINKGKIVLATVKGDIHDIGKNIVKVMLESYGFDIIDLGKDVEPEKILEVVLKNDVKLIGLSALMTTTVKSMENTINLLRENNVKVKVMVGGAVLTKEYANMIGADYYAKDAMETVKIAEDYFK